MIMDKNMILAKKYGRAIYELACEQNCIEQTEEELSLIISAIKENKDLQTLLYHPLLAKDVKKETIKELFASKVQPIVLQFCYVVIDKGRTSDLDAMVDVYTDLAHHGMGIEEAVITSAFPLTKQQAETLKEKLAELTGKKIIMKEKVDTALIGGFTVQMGDRLIDGSIARQLETLRSQMMKRD